MKTIKVILTTEYSVVETAEFNVFLNDDSEPEDYRQELLEYADSNMLWGESSHFNNGGMDIEYSVAPAFENCDLDLTTGE